MVRHPLALAGLTQASSVIPLVRSRLAESFTVIQLLVPLNDSALPYLPVALQVAPLIVPVFPCPERSLTVVPLPSSNEYAATSTRGGPKYVKPLVIVALPLALMIFTSTLVS